MFGLVVVVERWIIDASGLCFKPASINAILWAFVFTEMLRATGLYLCACFIAHSYAGVSVQVPPKIPVDLSANLETGIVVRSAF